MCDGGAIGDIFELEEGLPCFGSLTFVYKYLGDDPRDLGANLGIKLASDDGGVTVVGGEVASGEGAYGEFLGALGLSLLGRLAGAGGQERNPCGEEQEAKARDGKASMHHDSCGVVLLVCLLMKSAPQMGAVESVTAGGAGQVGRVVLCKDTPNLSSQRQPSGFSLGYEPRFGWGRGRGICPLSLARTYYI